MGRFWNIDFCNSYWTIYFVLRSSLYMLGTKDFWIRDMGGWGH